MTRREYWLSHDFRWRPTYAASNGPYKFFERQADRLWQWTGWWPAEDLMWFFRRRGW